MGGNLPVILIELVLVFGGVLAFAWWQLRSVARDRRETVARRAAQQAAEAIAAAPPAAPPPAATSAQSGTPAAEAPAEPR